ncbi:MAG: hypothetical protein PHW04_18270, partial [Candidatus Wallbacteria bacterium]|nr:hypothetical protein [Candidatus Wallbacteria bacterium]
FEQGLVDRALSVVSQFSGRQALRQKIGLYLKKDEQSALLILDEYRRKFPQDLEMLLLFGKLSWKFRKDEKAIDCLEQVITGTEAEGLKIEAIYQRALILFQMIRYKEAKREVDTLVNRGSDDVRFLKLSAALNFKFADYEGVIRILNRISEEETGYEEHLLLARAYKNSGKLELAESVLQRVLNEGGGHWELLRELAQIFDDSGDYGHAREYYLRLYREKEDLDSIRALVRVYLKCHEFERAIELIEREKLEEFYNELDKCYFHLGNFERIKDFQALPVSVENAKEYTLSGNYLFLEEKEGKYQVCRFKLGILLDQLQLGKDEEERLTEYICEADKAVSGNCPALSALTGLPEINLRKIREKLFPHLDKGELELFLSQLFPDCQSPGRIFKFFGQFSPETRGFFYHCGLLPDQLRPILPGSSGFSAGTVLPEIRAAGESFLKDAEWRDKQHSPSMDCFVLSERSFSLLYRKFLPTSRVSFDSVYQTRSLEFICEYLCGQQFDPDWAVVFFYTAFTNLPYQLCPHRYWEKAAILCGESLSGKGVIFQTAAHARREALAFDVEELIYDDLSGPELDLTALLDFISQFGNALPWISSRKAARIGREIRKLHLQVQQLRLSLRLPPQIVVGKEHTADANFRLLFNRISNIRGHFQDLALEKVNTGWEEILWLRFKKWQERLNAFTENLVSWTEDFLTIYSREDLLEMHFVHNTLPDRKYNVFREMDRDFLDRKARPFEISFTEQAAPGCHFSVRPEGYMEYNDYRLPPVSSLVIDDPSAFPVRFETRLLLSFDRNLTQRQQQDFAVWSFLGKQKDLHPSLSLSDRSGFFSGEESTASLEEGKINPKLCENRRRLYFPGQSWSTETVQEILSGGDMLIGGIDRVELFPFRENGGRSLLIAPDLPLYRELIRKYRLMLDFSSVILEKGVPESELELIKTATIVVLDPELLSDSRTFLKISSLDWSRVVITDADTLLFYDSAFSLKYLLQLAGLKSLTYSQLLFFLTRTDEFSKEQIIREFPAEGLICGPTVNSRVPAARGPAPTFRKIDFWKKYLELSGNPALSRDSIFCYFLIKLRLAEVILEGDDYRIFWKKTPRNPGEIPEELFLSLRLLGKGTLKVTEKCPYEGGILLVSGPPGSGKTTFLRKAFSTLQSLKMLDSPDLILIKDPLLPEFDGERSGYLGFKDFIRYISKMCGSEATSPFELYEWIGNEEKIELFQAGEYMVIDNAELMGKKQFEFLAKWAGFYGNLALASDSSAAGAISSWLTESGFSYSKVELPVSNTLAPNVALLYKRFTGSELGQTRGRSIKIEIIRLNEPEINSKNIGELGRDGAVVCSYHGNFGDTQGSGRIYHAEELRGYYFEVVAVLCEQRDFSREFMATQEFWLPYISARKRIRVFCFNHSDEAQSCLKEMEECLERKYA